MNARRVLVFAHDVIAACFAWVLAYWLRFNLEIPEEHYDLMIARLPLVAAVHAVVFLALGLYRGLWRYASVPDMQRILMAVGLAALAMPAVMALMRIAGPTPRTVYLLAPLLLVIVMGGSRLSYRA